MRRFAGYYEAFIIALFFNNSRYLLFECFYIFLFSFLRFRLIFIVSRCNNCIIQFLLFFAGKRCEENKKDCSVIIDISLRLLLHQFRLRNNKGNKTEV